MRGFHDGRLLMIKSQKLFTFPFSPLAQTWRPPVDAVFQTILKTRICGKLTGTVLGMSRKERCNRQADLFYNAVRAKGDGFL
ncbi:hypothetical protein AB0B89_04130 [Sphaerisporangium sp. NPDC049002]|uniref:hypothetical protein n=1 Tax=Sphaerisporangium sp. NPDC049002 TaxID=3155392 RepID=UPI0033F03793